MGIEATGAKGDPVYLLGGKSGVAGTKAVATKLPDTISLGELLGWLQLTMNKSDSAIRDQMGQIDSDKQLAAELTKVMTALKNAENIKSGDTGRDAKDLPNLNDYASQDWFKKLPKAAQDAYTWVAEDAKAGGDMIANEGAVKAAREAISDHLGSITSSNDLAMVKLQSAIAARGQAIQLISNMINGFNETNNRIIGNVK